MRNYYYLFTLTTILFISSFGFSQEVLQWSGADRNGNYPGSNLLKSWPEGGPSLLWEFDGLGNGYGSPVITSTHIFINGEVDTMSYLFALDLSGKLLWRSEIGKEWIQSYPGARSTPTVADDLIYVTSGLGTLACLETGTGKKRWSVNMIDDFNGKVPRFGFSESVLVDGGVVYCSPGNADTNVVALDRYTGKVLWISKGAGEMTSYTSPMMIKRIQRNILVTFSKTTMLGIDSKDGKLLWSYKQEGEDIDCQCNTPLFENGILYIVNGNGNGAVKFKLLDDGSQITEIWRNPRCDNLMGGFIKVNDFLYTSGYENRYYYSLDLESGKIVDSLKFDRGTIIYSDGMLYLYNEKGQVGLVKPEDGMMKLVSSFKLTGGTKAHFSHPVINKGILYIRHGKSLMAYDIQRK
jgi:outer membrane protein assembly factor BamB